MSMAGELNRSAELLSAIRTAARDELLTDLIVAAMLKTADEGFGTPQADRPVNSTI
jgi:hypothetical protein